MKVPKIEELIREGELRLAEKKEMMERAISLGISIHILPLSSE